jgi:Secretion system C-terminal sorting domain
LVAAGRGVVPGTFELFQNYPNPFNPTTTVRYQLASKMHAVVEVFDIVGKKVAVFDQGVRSAGAYSVVISADRWASGMYLCRLSAGGHEKAIKLLLIR